MDDSRRKEVERHRLLPKDGCPLKDEWMANSERGHCQDCWQRSRGVVPRRLRVGKQLPWKAARPFHWMDAKRSPKRAGKPNSLRTDGTRKWIAKEWTGASSWKSASYHHLKVGKSSRHHHHHRHPHVHHRRRRRRARLRGPRRWAWIEAAWRKSPRMLKRTRMLSAWLYSPFTRWISIRPMPGCGSPSSVRFPDSQKNVSSPDLEIVLSAEVRLPSEA